jgi:tetratricopeptide (TPR) repeat protein
MPSNDSSQGVPNQSVEGDESQPAGSDAGYSRETVLLSCLGLLLLLLAVTAFVSRMYHKKVHTLADQWFANGETEFRAGNPLEAAKDYRNALVYSEGNTVFQFHLAQALTAAHTKATDEEAQSYLLNLLAESAGSGEINLELARISSRQKSKASMQDALRYYNGAIYGVWPGDPLAQRWDARRELCEYLLSRGMTSQAQPETIALAQDVPQGDLARQKEAAAMLARADLWERALDEYKIILASHRRDSDALAGAGLSSFQLARYAQAVQYLDALPRTQRTMSDISTPLALAHEVEAISPFPDSLSRPERARRTVEALSRAKALAQSCSQRNGATPEPRSANSGKGGAQANSAAANSPLQKLQADLAQNSRAWKQLNFIRDPNQVDAAMNWVFQVENAAAQACGQPQDLMDRALLLVAKSRSGPEA